MTASLDKLRRETLDNFRDLIGDRAKGRNYWKALYRDASLPERHARGEVRLHLHVQRSLGDFCAVFQHFPPVADNDLGIVRLPCRNEPERLRPRRNYLNHAVLVRIVQFCEQEQGIPSSPTPSFVWLQALDDCLMFRAKTLDHVASANCELTPSPILGFTALEYRKLGSRCGCVRIEQRQLPSQVVQRGAQIVCDLADGDPPLQRRGPDFTSSVDLLRLSRIEFRGDNLVVWRVPERLLGVLECADLLYCTPYLESWAIERVGHGASVPERV